MPAEVESMMYTRVVPWHGLGTNVQESPTSEDALVAAGLNWNVEQRPLGFLDQIHKPQVKTIHGQNVEVPGHAVIRDVPGWFANVRDTDLSVLGVVSKQYKIIQNKDAFAFTDELLNFSNGSVRYETAGSLSGGRTVWLLAKMPEHVILGDTVDPYLVFTNSHNGKSSAKVFMSPIRVVCQNTLNIAIGNAQRMWTFAHVGDINVRIGEARSTLSLSEHYMNMLNDKAESLAMKKIPGMWLQMFIEQIFPIKDDFSESRTRMVEDTRSLLLNIYNNRADLANFRGTGWGLLNAVTDMVNHRPFGPTTTVTKRTFERKFERIISGDNIVDKAVEFLEAM